MSHLEVRHGDLVEQNDLEVIVNTWNRNFIPWWLLLPQGVSGSIKKRGGYAPFREIGRAGLLKPGDAVMTTAGRLPFRGIIHVAGLDATWRSSPGIIRRCVVEALDLTEARGVSSIGFPLIGAGTGGVKEEVALEVMKEEVARHPSQARVVIVLFEG